MSASNGDTEDGTGPDLEQFISATEALACEKCRKAKLRCSKERPSCSHCRRTQSECTYATKRMKPGVKPGAIEAIHRRLDLLEQRAEQQANTVHSPSTGEAFPDASNVISNKAQNRGRTFECSHTSNFHSQQEAKGQRGELSNHRHP
ncbi:hypothetical protein CKM354_000437400 [Cercospora kikuchii]|uniref:Zn(2)-C6 fungal-type domain-containing protein n=1 Tax=Cercospora kikuchii TaxID=84275 RepID=A0A9P3FEJ8_9PEZI|nr:uncharacterized protein CKM354_000437400 [Cercospora kikuchii]GIZ41057.1 hypothetical protein CKM354_000437400 [Cercospora kikuchii]